MYHRKTRFNPWPLGCRCRCWHMHRLLRLLCSSPLARTLLVYASHAGVPPTPAACSTVLPVPFAFSRLGVLPGILLMLFVALGNALAGTLLLRCAGSLGAYSYEGLAEAVGGKSWKVRRQHNLLGAASRVLATARRR